MTDEKELPADVRQFIEENIESYGQLQILLLLAKDPKRVWTSVAVGQELRTNDWSSEKLLAGLASRGVVTRIAGNPSQYSFDTTDVRLIEIVNKVVSTHAIYYLRIISLIYDRPARNLQVFADAFKIRKEDENG